MKLCRGCLTQHRFIIHSSNALAGLSGEMTFLYRLLKKTYPRKHSSLNPFLKIMSLISLESSVIALYEIRHWEKQNGLD